MKKVLLSMAVVALLATGCKKAKEAGSDLKDAAVEVTDKAVDATGDAANAVVEGAEDAADAVKEGAEGVVEGAKEAVESALGGITIPSFSNPAVAENLKEYAVYAKDYIAANGNLGKISALAPKGAALLAKGKELASKLDVKEMAKYKSVLSAIQSKMAPAQ